jgi:ADP-ribose pyrophosphatase
MKEITKSSKKVYECSFMSLFEDHVILPDQNESKRVFIKHPGGAAVLPITKDGKLILVNQFRYPIQSVSLEIPAGKKDIQGESSYSCAKRELEEETGHISDDITHLFTIHPCVGYSDEILDIFIARDCIKINNPKQMDIDEFIEVVYLTQKQAIKSLDENKITDAKTIIAIQAFIMMNSNQL